MKNNKKQNLTPIEDLISVVNAGENSGMSEEKSINTPSIRLRHLYLLIGGS